MPVEILKLVNLILEGIDLSERGFLKELLALALLVMFNFRFNRDGKRQSLKKKRHDQKNHPFPFTLLRKFTVIVAQNP